MKKNYLLGIVIAVVFWGTILISSMSACAGEIELEQVISKIVSTMPPTWKVYDINYDVKPYWSFSENQATRIQVYGPIMNGYDYYDTDSGVKKHITRWLFSNESRLLWIVTDDFDPQWTVSNRIKNRLSKTPVSYPIKISNMNGIHVYGEDKCSVVLPENQQKLKTSPLGTNLAEPIPQKHGGSWPTWIEDVRKGLEMLKVE